ncbi:hypothetical protein B9G98_00432 [Wickerhamiella sorbophila]|uniref:Uncharacterized protein n=1 Tax=Wickerhamiella sorbophila TaxID=45607 RepID=A0A2T0FCT1_9ASCO|nr:hypothetical protein B9G98_00432 [Wickerhamiella sorbophila]PRT52812.1 hypothetical protein B9G98_00432 [Wickerhamiella sorbophila]
MNLSYSASPTSSNGSYFSETSRPSSTSPTFSRSSLSHSSKCRMDAGRGFDPEDDMLFCPALAPTEPLAPRSYANIQSNSVRSPEFVPREVRTTSMQTPLAATLRARRALEIIDPATGLRVESPRPAGR